MLRKGWIIGLICALTVGPLLFALGVISGTVAWLLCLGFAALIVGSLVFGEQARRRSTRAPFDLLQNYNGELDEQRDAAASAAKDGKTAPRILTK